MASPFNDLLSKAEAACKSAIDALALSGVTINTGIEDETIALPYVVCYASGSTEEIPDTGLDRVRMEVIMCSDAEATTGLVTHRARVAQIIDLFRDADIITTLGAAETDFGVMEVAFDSQSAEMEDHKLKNTMELDIICCSKDLT